MDVYIWKGFRSLQTPMMQLLPNARGLRAEPVSKLCFVAGASFISSGARWFGRQTAKSRSPRLSGFLSVSDNTLASLLGLQPSEAKILKPPSLAIEAQNFAAHKFSLRELQECVDGSTGVE